MRSVADLLRACPRAAASRVRGGQAVDALNQNMNVSAPTVSQRAAVAALSAQAKPELLSHVQVNEPSHPV